MKADILLAFIFYLTKTSHQEGDDINANQLDRKNSFEIIEARWPVVRYYSKENVKDTL